MIESIFLQDALRAYSDLGMADDVERLKPAVQRATQRVTEELTEVRAEVSIPIQEIEKEVDNLLEVSRPKGEWHHLYAIACTKSLWPSWEDVVGRQEELDREFPLQTLVRKQLITPDGRPLPRPEDPEAARLFDQIGQFAQQQRIALTLTQVRVQLLRDRGAWNVDLIRTAMSKGSLFSDSVIGAVLPGIEAFERGRHWESLHVLVLQVERVIRRLGLAVGAETFSYEVGPGRLRWKSLESMLDDSAIAGVLSTIRDDWPQQLKYTLVDPMGWNLRNSVGHGILDVSDEDPGAASLMIILILLCLAALQTAEETADPRD
jgi:hypothetical protein